LDLVRSRTYELLALGDEELIKALGAPKLRGALERFDAGEIRGALERAGIETVCSCEPAYPARLAELPRAPAALFVAGGLERALALLGDEPVAIVGARRASSYGLAVARSLGRGVASTGVTVISGMAMGVDSAAHEGALSAGPTVAVLPGPADRPYPAGKRSLYRRILDAGAVISELPPGTEIRRWMFPARNRVIAALSAITVVVEAGHRSGALLTASCAAGIGRPIGAVPGRVTSPQSAGPNALLARGAQVIRDPQDVLDALFGAGARRVRADPRSALDSDHTALLRALGGGQDTIEALARVGFQSDWLLTALASLELDGYVRRDLGGRFAVVP
jgi:DNA processing protein